MSNHVDKVANLMCQSSASVLVESSISDFERFTTLVANYALRDANDAGN